MEIIYYPNVINSKHIFHVKETRASLEGRIPQVGARCRSTQVTVALQISLHSTLLQETYKETG